MCVPQPNDEEWGNGELLLARFSLAPTSHRGNNIEYLGDVLQAATSIPKGVKPWE